MAAVTGFGWDEERGGDGSHAYALSGNWCDQLFRFVS